MVKDIFVNGNGGILGAVARLGLPIVLSLVLTSFLIFKVDTALSAAVGQSTTNTKLIVDAGTSMRGFRDTQEANLRVLRRLSLQTCRNTARNPEQLAACDRASED